MCCFKVGGVEADRPLAGIRRLGLGCTPQVASKDIVAKVAIRSAEHERLDNLECMFLLLMGDVVVSHEV